MALVLVKATAQADIEIVGKQAGARTFLVLETNHFDELYKQYQDKGISFISKPVTKGWGRQVQLNDLYGYHLVLLEVTSH